MVDIGLEGSCTRAELGEYNWMNLLVSLSPPQYLSERSHDSFTYDFHVNTYLGHTRWAPRVAITQERKGICRDVDMIGRRNFYFKPCSYALHLKFFPQRLSTDF
jgi:hypothetical protein